MKTKTVVRSAFEAESEKWDEGRTNGKRENVRACVLCVRARVLCLYIYIYFSKYCIYSRVTPGKSKTSKLLNVSHCVEKESSLQHSYKHAIFHYLGPLNSFHQVPFRSLYYLFQFYIPFQENVLQKYCTVPGRWIHRFCKRSFLINFMCGCFSLLT